MTAFPIRNRLAATLLVALGLVARPFAGPQVYSDPAVELIDLREYAGGGRNGEAAHVVRLDFWVQAPGAVTFNPTPPPGSTIKPGSDAYTVAYAYGPAGDRATMTQTDNGTVVARWGYADYVMAGTPDAPARPFTALTRLDASGSPTAEEFHYAYDSTGRLVASAFAQTPQSGGAYATRAASRAVAWYTYDPAGRLLDLSTYWDVNGSTPVLVAQNACGYELSNNASNANRGLKTSSFLKLQNAAGTGYDSHTEVFGYEAQRDFLTSAQYNDGNPADNYVWSYDAAGNRNDATCDSLNRASAVAGVSYTNDVLGNRTAKTANGFTFYYDWDCLNRMTGHGRSGAWAAYYDYRADGMRTGKFYNSALTRYRYDGQMGVEDVEFTTAGAVSAVTKYGLGARGVDFIERTSGSTVTTGFPIYDAHGNMVATLSRSGTNGYAVNDRRGYSAWGDVRTGNQTGDPKGRYCASLGHRMDDEGGYVYMRARYYQPTEGRFLSEDPGMSGNNWFVYADNCPASKSDANGRDPVDDILTALRWADSVARKNPDTQEAIRMIARLCERFREIARMAKINAIRSFAEAEAVDTGAAIGGAEATEMELEFANDRRAAGVRHLAVRALAMIGMRQIETLIETLSVDLP